MEQTGRLDRGDGVELAWAFLPGRTPAVVFLPGYASDMSGLKATMLAELCAAHGLAFLRFDYSGHGVSGGAFEDGSIGRWAADALAVIDHATQGKLLLVGSSMGGWIALLIGLARAGRIAGFVGIAAAPDFTERLMWNAMSPAERTRLMQDGAIEAPNRYGPSFRITRKLIEDGRTHMLLDAPIALRCPVRLLQGQRDEDVPWETAITLLARLETEDARIILIKDGDHRLSRPEDLELLGQTILALLGQDGAQPLAVAGIAPG